MLFTPVTNYDKTIIFGLTLFVAIVGPILASNLDLGIPRVVLNWLSLGVGISGGLVGLFQQNKNQPTIPPYHAIVDVHDIKSGANIVAEHKS